MRNGIELLRVICLIIVTLFHTVSRYDNPDIITELPEIFRWIIRQLIWIAVPMFLFISGFLFSGQINNNRFTSCRDLIVNKFQRILIPYICFTCLIMLSSGFFDYTQLFKGNFWHLWFLPTLFCCFVVYFFIFNYINKCRRKNRFIESLIFIISFACCTISIPEKFCFMGIDGLIKFYSTPYMTVTWNNTLAVCSMLLVVFYFINNIKLKPSINKIILPVAASSMGIYILHYWILIYATSSTSLRIMGLFENKSQTYVIFMLLTISIVVISVSYILTSLLKSNRFLKISIG